MSQPVEHTPIDLAREADFQLGGTRVSPASREVVVAAQIETLEPRVMQVLVALAQGRGTVVSREELSARCWSGRVVGDDALNRCIARLRRLADANGDFKLETIPRVGYRLTTGTGSDAPVVGVSPPLPAVAARGPRFGHRAFIAALSVVIVAAAIGSYFWMRDSRRTQAALESHTFIVLPFAALTDDSDTRLFAQSLAATIADVLSQAGRRVVSPAQAEKFRGIELARATEATGARFVVNGEVRREKDSINVVMRVDDGRTGRTLMSNAFERNADDAARLAEIVAGFVGVRSWTYVPDAIESDRPEMNEAGFREAAMLASGKSRAAYDLAVTMARKYPDDLQAQLQFAAFSTFNYWALEQDEVEPAMRAARESVERVEKRAPRYGDVYTARSLLLPPQHWAKRETLLRKAMAIDPDTLFAGHTLAGFLGEVGRLHDAEQLERGELGRDPLNLEKIQRHMVLLSMVGNRTDAATLIELGNRYDPGDAQMAVRRFISSDFRGAAPEAASMMTDSEIAAIIEPSERKPQIRGMLRALESRRVADMDAAVAGCTPVWVSFQTTAACLAGMSELGRLDDAFVYATAKYPDQRAATEAIEDEQWLRRERGFADTTLLYRAEMAPMRADPRFVALAENLRLLDYWRSGYPPDFCQTEHAPVCESIGKP